MILTNGTLQHKQESTYHLEQEKRSGHHGSSASPLSNSMIGETVQDFRRDLQKHIATIAVARDIQGILPLDQPAIDGILSTSAQLRSLADRLDTLLTDVPLEAMQANNPGLLASQLEQYSKDLRAIRKQRNSAREDTKSVRLQALKKLVAAATLKDDDTGQHIARIGYFCETIARNAGQPEHYCEQLLHASRMHDVGKIGIPDAILKKPGKLTDAEWAVMRTHPKIGAVLMGDSDDPLFNLAAEVSLVHHEKFDGSGYPNQLRGEEIPLSGRIVALADYFDALTMNRCYRPAMSDEQAMLMIREQSGKHFDPALVDIFFESLEEIIEIRAAISRNELQ